MNNLKLALKDWKTTVPGALLAVFGILSAFGIATFPDGVQQAILVVVLFVVGLFAGGIGDLKTTIPAVIIALCGLVVYFLGIVIPGNVVMGFVAVSTTVLGLLSGTIDDLKTTVPSAVLGFFAALGFVLAFWGITIPPNLAQAVATIALVLIALLTGQPIPLPVPPKTVPISSN